MDISFESMEIPVYREYDCQSRRTQESVECVVPDTDADIGKIAAVQSEVFLKSKDLSARGVLVSGELSASVLYIRDDKEGVSFLRIRKPFSLEFELEKPESETLSQVALFVQGTDVRLLNPRKISLAFEIEGILFSYSREMLRVESKLPDSAPGLHARTEEQTVTLPGAVCEKSLAVNEQFSLPREDALPEALIGEKASLTITDCQMIGNKLIVKGNAAFRIIAASPEREIPYTASFSAPFSQIVDVGTERMSHCAIRPEITGAYYDLTETINGEKVLDVELHAVLQLVVCEPQEIRCITDAYSNLMPADLLCRTQAYRELFPAETVRLGTEEKLSLTEECRELLHVFASVSRILGEAGKLSAAVSLDFVFKNGDNQLSACRRGVMLTKEIGQESPRVLGVKDLQVETKTDGENVLCSVSLELSCADARQKEISMVDGIILDEENLYLQDALPTLTLVRAEGETLWELAKKHHSSVERIGEMNENTENPTRMLLIPKCI